MRIVAVADTHTLEKRLPRIPDGDLFVHAGDMLNRGTLEELEVVAAWIRQLPHRHKLVIAGNHDWCFAHHKNQAVGMLGRDVHYLQDSGVLIEGLYFWGSPWQPEFFSWAFNLSRGAPLRAKWALIPQSTNVLITHGPPRGFGDCVDGGHVGCKELLAAVRRVQPMLHLFGHIHEDGGAWHVGGALISNVTTWDCRSGATVFDVDPCTKVATVVETA